MNVLYGVITAVGAVIGISIISTVIAGSTWADNTTKMIMGYVPVFAGLGLLGYVGYMFVGRIM